MVGGAALTDSVVIYEVHEATNGYYAVLGSGKVVIGKTLAEVTSEANALVTEEMTTAGTSPALIVEDGWVKG